MNNYVVTALKPTVVLDSVTGRFTGPHDINLIVNKCTTLDIFVITPSGLQQLESLPIYGRVAAMELFRPESSDQDWLFFLTDKLCFSVIRYNRESETFETMAYGDAQETTGRQSESGPLCMVDPLRRMIGLHMYNGTLRVIPMDAEGSLGEMFSVRLEEICILDMKLLHPCSSLRSNKPLLVVLYANPKNASSEARQGTGGEVSCSVHMSSYFVNLEDQELEDGPFSIDKLDWSASLLAPVPAPCGGVLVLGSQSIAYVNVEGTAHAMETDHPLNCVAYDTLDSNGGRFLLGDGSGEMSILALTQADDRVVEMVLEVIGKTCIPSSVSYLDNGFVFVGSYFGDSELISLQEEADESGSFITVHDSFPNVGPIVDLAVVDFERQGQGQVVTCSGGKHEGSLRIVRVGVEINEHAQLDLPGVKGMWSLKPTADSSTQKYIVFSFVGETRVLGMTEEQELEETDLSGFDCSAATLHCRNAGGSCAVQVTAAGVRLINLETGECLTQWSPPNPDQTISLASSNQTQVVVAAGLQLHYLRIEAESLSLESSLTLENEASCLDVDFPSVSASAEEGVSASSPTPAVDSPIVAVGMWDDISVRILKLPSLELVSHELLGGEFIARSILLARFDNISYMLCGLGDGSLCSFVLDLDTFALTQRKKISLGTQPLLLQRFDHLGTNHVFAASDRPTIIYSNNGKLLYSTVNLKDVSNMCSFASEESPDTLAISTDSNLIIGTVDDLQKLHVRAVNLGMEPVAISHQESTSTFLVGVNTTVEGETRSMVEVVDEKSLEKLDVMEMEAAECVSAICSMKFKDDDTEYFVVGTAFVQDEETEPSVGRILVLEFREGSLLLAGQAPVHGAVYSLAPIRGNLLAAVNSKLEIFSWSTHGERERGSLASVCKHNGHVLTLQVKTRGDFIASVDIMKSMSVYLYDQEKESLVEIARHLYQCWGTAGAMLEDDLMLQADSQKNLMSFRRNTDCAMGEEDRERLEVVGEYHLGDSINVMQPGSLVMHTPEADAINVLSSTIYATVSGALGLILQLTPEDFEILRKVEKKLATDVISGIGGLKHAQYREFVKTKGSSPAHGFVDGDLIEQLLDLPREKLEEVATSCQISPEALLFKVESLSQMH